MAPTLFDSGFYEDPYPAYTQMRAESPVARLDLPEGPLWLVTRYEDARAAFADPRFAKDWRVTLPEEQRAGTPAGPLPMMLLMDPPDHTRLRRLVSRSFTARRMSELRPQVQAIADALLADLPAAGHVDLMESFAFPLPVRVICELLGVPERDHEDFRRWSSTMVDDSPSDVVQDASRQLAGYLEELVERKRAEPDDALLAGLVAVADTDGDRLSPEELVGMAMLLLVAGHETTVHLIGNGALALLTRPAQRALLARRPELWPAAVEEILRFDSPVTNAPARFTTEDVKIAGTVIPAGSVVMLGIGSANRDELRFPHPAALDVSRDDGGHLAFGHGIHHCLGAPLARIEGEVALRTLLTTRPALALAVDPAELVHRRSTLVRGVTALPVEPGPAYEA